MNKCQYCEKLFSTISNLNTHQKTAKYCINIRNNVIIEEYKCYCEKKFNCKKNYTRHKKSCNFYDIVNPYIEENIKLNNQNIEYLKQLENKDKEYLKQLENKDRHIKQLELQLANIALAGVTKVSTINNINNSNKILNIGCLDLNSSDKIKTILDDKFDHNYIIDGQKGVAQFVVDHYLKDDDGKLKYVCTDPSRQIFKYKDDLGDIQKDVKAKKLTKTLIDGGLKEKNNIISEFWWTTNEGKTDKDKFIVLQPKTTEINSLSISENTLFANELSSMTTI